MLLAFARRYLLPGRCFADTGQDDEASLSKSFIISRFRPRFQSRQRPPSFRIGTPSFANPNEIWMRCEKSPKAADRVYQFQRVPVISKIAGMRRDVIHGYPQVLFAVRAKNASGKLVWVFDTSSASDRENPLKLETGNLVDISGICTAKRDNWIILLGSEIRER